MRCKRAKIGLKLEVRISCDDALVRVGGIKVEVYSSGASLAHTKVRSLCSFFARLYCNGDGDEGERFRSRHLFSYAKRLQWIGATTRLLKCHATNKCQLSLLRSATATELERE